MNQNDGSDSLDLPPALRELLQPSNNAPMVQQAPIGGLGSVTSGIPSFAMGGTVGPGGMPMRPGAMPGQMPGQMQGQPGMAGPGASNAVSPQQVQAEAQRFVDQHPQEVARIRQVIEQAVQSGELSPQELNMMVQMATAAVQNPSMYPQLRKLAIQQGLAGEQDLSPEFDPGLLFTIIVAGRAAGGAVPQGQMISRKDGGALPERSPHPGGAIPIMAHENEYVVPAHVVRAKGTEFFDKLVQNYDPSRSDKTS